MGGASGGACSFPPLARPPPPLVMGKGDGAMGAAAGGAAGMADWMAQCTGRRPKGWREATSFDEAVKGGVVARSFSGKAPPPRTRNSPFRPRRMTCVGTANGYRHTTHHETPI